MLFSFVIRFEIPSFTHPLEVVMLFGFVIRFEIPSFTHPLRGSNVVRFCYTV